MGEAWLPRQNHQAAGKAGASGSAEKTEKRPHRIRRWNWGSVETRMGKKTIELHHVSKRYGEKKILEDYSYIVLKNPAAWYHRPKTDAEKSHGHENDRRAGGAGFRKD